MTKRLQSKNKIIRKLSMDVWGTRERANKQRYKHRPGEHGSAPVRSKNNETLLTGNTQVNLLSEREAKQRLVKYYGNITEKQFKATYLKATKLKGKIGDNLIKLLERRLDIIVYRLNFSNSVFLARQLVNHGHILVNGKPVTIPSYQLNEGDLIQVKESSLPFVKQNITDAFFNKQVPSNVPEYLEVDYHSLSAVYIYSPSINEVPYPVDFLLTPNPQLLAKRGLMIEPKLITELVTRYYSK